MSEWVEGFALFSVFHFSLTQSLNFSFGIFTALEGLWGEIHNVALSGIAHTI